MAAGDEQDLTEAVVTCEGNLHDPDFQDRFHTLVEKLKSVLYISKTKDPFRVRKIEPWNSVRVTISIPKEAAQKLKLLAQQGSNVLRSMGILSVQVEGDQVISLTWAAHNNEATQVILRQTSDESAGSSGTSGISSSSLPASSPSISSISSSVASISSPVPLTPGSSTDTGGVAITLDMLSSPSSSAFRSPNVVAPCGEAIPILPPKTPATVTRPALGGPFPFASMTHAAQAIQRSELTPILNSNNVVISSNNTSNSNAANSTNSIASSVPASSSSLFQGTCKPVQPSQSNLLPVTVSTNPASSSSIAPVIVSTSACNVVTTVNVSSESQVTRLIIDNSSGLNPSSQAVGNTMASLGISGNHSNVALSQAGPSQSLQLQLVNVPPPYPGVNTISSNHSVNSTSTNSSILTNNVQSQHQQQQPMLMGSSPSVPAISNVPTTVTMVSSTNSQTLISRTASGFIGEVPSVAPVANISDSTSGVSSLAQPVSSPLLVNLLQNNDVSPASSSASLDVYNQQQQQVLPKNTNIPTPVSNLGENVQQARYLAQQQQQLKKTKRGLSVDGASSVPKGVPMGALSGSDSVLTVVTPTTQTNVTESFQFALPLPSDTGSPVTLNRVAIPVASNNKHGNPASNQTANDQSSVAVLQGRTIVQGNIRILDQGSGQLRTIPLHQQQQPYPSTTMTTLTSLQGKTVLTGVTTTASHSLNNQLSLLSDQVTALANGPISASSLPQSNMKSFSDGDEVKSQQMATVTLVQPVEQQALDRDVSRTAPASSAVDQSRTLLPITTVNIVSKSPHKSSSNVNNNNSKESDSKTFIPPPDPRLSSQVQKLSHSNSVSIKNSTTASNMVVQTSYNSDAKSSTSQLYPAGRTATVNKRSAKDRSTTFPTQLASPGKPRQFLINPLTGHLEPMPSESSSESEGDDGEGEAGRKSNSHKGSLHRNKLGRGTLLAGIHHRQIVTTETGVTVARVIKASADPNTSLAQSYGDVDGKKAPGHSQMKGTLVTSNSSESINASNLASIVSVSKKPREDSTAAALHISSQKDSKDIPSPTTVTATSVPGEKIKLRLKLEKSEPISPAYKVDVSFVKKSEKGSVLPSGAGSNVTASTSSMPSSGSQPVSTDQPRVPPLHISLRGKNAAVVVSPRREDRDISIGNSGNTKDPSVSNKDISTSEVLASFTLPPLPKSTSHLANSHDGKSGGKTGGNSKRVKSRVKSFDGTRIIEKGLSGEKVKTKVSRPKLSKEISNSSRNTSVVDDGKDSAHLIMPVLQPAVTLPVATDSRNTDKPIAPSVQAGKTTLDAALNTTELAGAAKLVPESKHKVEPGIASVPELSVEPAACPSQQPNNMQTETEKPNPEATCTPLPIDSTEPPDLVTAPPLKPDPEEKDNSPNIAPSIPEPPSLPDEVIHSSQSVEMNELPQENKIFKGAFSSEISSIVNVSEEKQIVDSSTSASDPHMDMDISAKDDSFANPVINLPTVSCDIIKGSESQDVSGKEDSTGFDCALTSHHESPAVNPQELQFSATGATPMEVDEEVNEVETESTAVPTISSPVPLLDEQVTITEGKDKGSDISETIPPVSDVTVEVNQIDQEEVLHEAVENDRMDHQDGVVGEAEDANVIKDESAKDDSQLELCPTVDTLLNADESIPQTIEENPAQTTSSMAHESEPVQGHVQDEPEREEKNIDEADPSSSEDTVLDKDEIEEKPLPTAESTTVEQEQIREDLVQPVEATDLSGVSHPSPKNETNDILDNLDTQNSDTVGEVIPATSNSNESQDEELQNCEQVALVTEKLESTQTTSSPAVLNETDNVKRDDIATESDEKESPLIESSDKAEETNVDETESTNTCIPENVFQTNDSSISVEIEAKPEDDVVVQPKVDDGITDSELENVVDPLPETDAHEVVETKDMPDAELQECPTNMEVEKVTELTTETTNATVSDLFANEIKSTDNQIVVKSSEDDTKIEMSSEASEVENPEGANIVPSETLDAIGDNCEVQQNEIKEEVNVYHDDTKEEIRIPSPISNVEPVTLSTPETVPEADPVETEIQPTSEHSENNEEKEQEASTIPDVEALKAEASITDVEMSVNVDVSDVDNAPCIQEENAGEPVEPLSNAVENVEPDSDAGVMSKSDNEAAETATHRRSPTTVPQLVSISSPVPKSFVEEKQSATQANEKVEICENSSDSSQAPPVSVTIITPKNPVEVPVSTTNDPPISIVLPSESALKSNNPDGKSVLPKNTYKRRAEIKPGALQNTLKRLHDNFLPKVLKSSDKSDASGDHSNMAPTDVDGGSELPSTPEPPTTSPNPGTASNDPKPNTPHSQVTQPQPQVSIAVSQVRPLIQRQKAVKPASPMHHQIPSNIIATVTSTSGITTVTTLSVPSSSSSGGPQTVFAIHPNVSIPANFAQLQQSPVVLPGGHKMVPIKLVTLPKQSGGQLQTIPLGNAASNRSSPNLLEAVNIVANAGSRSSSPKTTLIGNAMQSTPLNLSSMSLPVGGNLHFVPISMSSATGTTGNVKVLMTQPIKMQQAGLSQSMVVKSVLMGSQPTTIRVIRPANLQEPIGIQTLIKPPGHAVNEVQKPKLEITTTESAKLKNDFVQSESLFKRLDGVEIVETGSPLNNDDLPFEADIIHDEKDLADVLAAEAKNELIENCTNYHLDLKSNDIKSSGKVKKSATKPETPAAITQNHIASKKLLRVGQEGASTPDSPAPAMGMASPAFTYSTKASQDRRTGSRSPSPSNPDGPDLHGEDQEIINSFSRSPTQLRCSPQSKTLLQDSQDIKTSTSDLLPDHTYGISSGASLANCETNNIDQELSIEIPPMEIEGAALSPSQNPPEEKRCTRSTRSNTRLSPDITAFMSDTPKPAKLSVKVDSLTLKNSPKPSPTGSLKVLSPTPSSLTITPSTSTRSSPILHNQHQINASNAAATINAVALGIIDKIQGNSAGQSVKNSRVSKQSGVNKRKRQESDSSSASRDENVEEKTEIDLNSRPGKRKCSENAAEMIKVCIGVEDSPKRNSSTVKKTDESKLKDGKGKKTMATVLEEEDDVDSEVSLPRGRSGRSSRESSEDRSSSRGSSAQRMVTNVEKLKTSKEEEPSKDTKTSRLNSRAGKDTGAKLKSQSGRVSPHPSATPAKKAKESGKTVTRRPNRPNSKDTSPLTPAKTRTNVRKDIVATQTQPEKNATGTPTGPTPENENARRKTRSSAAVDTSDSEISHVKRRRISKDANS